MTFRLKITPMLYGECKRWHWQVWHKEGFPENGREGTSRTVQEAREAARYGAYLLRHAAQDPVEETIEI